MEKEIIKKNWQRVNRLLLMIKMCQKKGHTFSKEKYYTYLWKAI